MKSEVASRVKFDRIRYAQCWEDPRLNQIALEIGPGDHVLSIASGGDNSFAHLLDDPEQVTAIDLNPVQIALCELKKAAISQLDYSDFLGFLGVRPLADRLRLYRLLRPYLPVETKGFFDANEEFIEQGVIHTGKFELYFHHFRSKFLPLIHSRKTIEEISACMTIEEQREYYFDNWNSLRWRSLFQLFFGKFMLGRLGRDPEFFKYVKIDQVGNHFYKRAEHAFTSFLIQENFFITYIFFGNYRHRRVMPPYLLPQNFETLRQRIGRLEFRLVSVEQYLNQVPVDTVSRINFSDIFEYISEDSMADIYRAIARRGRVGTRIAYWNLLVPRQCPSAVSEYYETDHALGTRLHEEDHSFVYSRYVVETLSKRLEE